MSTTQQFNPSYAVPPGWILEEYLETFDLSQAQFARACGRSAKLISQIISGDAPVEPQTAIEFQRVLGLDASIWLNLEAAYRLKQAQDKEVKALEDKICWAKSFPLKDMRSLGLIPREAKNEKLVSSLLEFFSLGSPSVWEEQHCNLRTKLQFKKQDAHELSYHSLSVWLKLGEIEAQKQNCRDYDKSVFSSNLKKIRSLTMDDPQVFYPKLVSLCNEAGVALAVLPKLEKLPVSGIARWLSPRKALISLSLRFRTNDHFWFSFFHEAAHILLHSKKDVFVDLKDDKEANKKEEREANNWAAEFLIPKHEIQCLLCEKITAKSITKAAIKLNVHPAILVGRLQHEKVITWKQFNSFKKSFELVTDQPER